MVVSHCMGRPSALWVTWHRSLMQVHFCYISADAGKLQRCAHWQTWRSSQQLSPGGGTALHSVGQEWVSAVVVMHENVTVASMSVTCYESMSATE
jgi:hypothetical protein